MRKCALCDNPVNFLRNTVIYLGTEKGSLEITDSQPICKKCSEKMTDSPDVKQLVKISSLMRNGQFKEALESFKPIFNKCSPASNYSIGNIYAGLQEFDDALKYYDNALFLHTHYIKAWYKKGMTLFELKNFEKFDDAVKCFENVIKLDPTNDTKWPLSAEFYILLIRILQHNKIGESGTLSPYADKINELLIKFFPIIMSIESLQKYTQTLMDLYNQKMFDKFFNDYVDFCFIKRNEIFDALEPTIIFEAYSPQNKWIWSPE